MKLAEIKQKARSFGISDEGIRGSAFIVLFVLADGIVLVDIQYRMW